MQSAEVAVVTTIKGIPFPAGVRFGQIIVTGPPGSGKSMLVAKLGGWPQEGYLDLARKYWWRDTVLALRPREVHLGLPFQGYKESHAVFDPDWLAAPTSLDVERIQLPPLKRRFWHTDWYAKYAFDFQLLPPDRIYAIRSARAKVGLHPGDVGLTLDQVRRQVAAYADVARYLHRCGLSVFFRESFEGMPRRFV